MIPMCHIHVTNNMFNAYTKITWKILGMCEFKILSSNRIEFIKFRIESNFEFMR